MHRKGLYSCPFTAAINSTWSNCVCVSSTLTLAENSMFAFKEVISVQMN